jgi:hypothetical protein
MTGGLSGDLHVPRVLILLAVVGVGYGMNELAPGVLQAVLLLLIAYVVLTNADRAKGLINSVPRGLGRAYRPRGAATTASSSSTSSDVHQTA